MTTQEKFWYLIGSVIGSFTYAMTFPITEIYFINLIGTTVLALSNMIGTALSAIVYWTVPKENLKSWYRRHFSWIVVIDTVLLWCINFAGYSYPEIRFIGFAIINAVSTCLWVMIMKNIANRIIVDGDERTDFEALTEYVTLFACLVGATITFLFPDILSVEYCLIIQCAANMFMGITDVYIFKRLNKTYSLKL